MSLINAEIFQICDAIAAQGRGGDEDPIGLTSLAIYLQQMEDRIEALEARHKAHLHILSLVAEELRYLRGTKK
jgi:hypothetical protein